MGFFFLTQLQDHTGSHPVTNGMQSYAEHKRVSKYHPELENIVNSSPKMLSSNHVDF